MKRFYIKKVSDYISIVHRPTHEIIYRGELGDESKGVLKRLLEIDTKGYYDYLINSVGIKAGTSSLLEEPDKEKEEWYKKAWIMSTEQIMEQYGLGEVPEEDVPMDYIRVLKTKKNKKNWSVGEETESPEDKPEKPEKKKPLKKSKKKSLKKKTKKKKLKKLKK